MLTSDPDFTPPFCPNPDCVHHRERPVGWSWAPFGTFRRRAPPHVIRRFRCRTCRRTFSTQTFDTTYWLKRPDLQPQIMLRLVECGAFRQIGRGLGVVHSTVLRQTERLGRHCLLFQHLHGPRGEATEELVLDGFRTFELSQFWPVDFNLLVGQRSHFMYGFTDAELRRSGTMTGWQAHRRDVLEARHGRPDPRATEREVEELLRSVFPRPRSLTLHTDEHQAYPRAFGRTEHVIEHHRTSSRQLRTPRNPLFAVNLADLLIRHSSACHKRETIAFSKRRQSSAERLAVFQVWRNFMKRFSERRPRETVSPAMTLGLVTRLLDAGDVLRRRLFPSLVKLPARFQRYYDRLVETRQLPTNRTHALRLAY